MLRKHGRITKPSSAKIGGALKASMKHHASLSRDHRSQNTNLGSLVHSLKALRLDAGKDKHFPRYIQF